MNKKTYLEEYTEIINESTKDNPELYDRLYELVASSLLFRALFLGEITKGKGIGQLLYRSGLTKTSNEETPNIPEFLDTYRTEEVKMIARYRKDHPELKDVTPAAKTIKTFLNKLQN